MRTKSQRVRPLSLELIGTPYFSTVMVEFARGVTAIIGDRGSGKSTIIDTVRYTLGSTGPAWTKDNEERVRLNLGAGRARVRVQTSAGTIYLIERSYGQPPRVFDEHGNEAKVSLEQLQVDVVGQNELEATGATHEAQLTLLDQVIAEELRPVKEQIATVKDELKKDIAKIRALEADVRLLTDRAAQAEMIEKDLRLLDEAAANEDPSLKLAHAHRGLRQRELNSMDSTLSKLAKAKEDLHGTYGSVRGDLARAVEEDVLEGPNGGLFQPVVGAVQHVVGTMEALMGQIAAEIDAARTLATRQRGVLTEHQAKQEVTYATQQANAKDASKRAADRVELQKRYADVSSAPRDLAAKQADLRALHAIRSEKLGRFEALQQARSSAREALFESINKALESVKVHVRLDKQGNKKEFVTLLNSMLKLFSTRPAPTSEQIAKHFTPAELVDVVKRGDAKELSERTEMKLARAEDAIKCLAAEPRLHELECVDTDDLAAIEAIHGKKRRDATKLSPGERCAAILPVILAMRDRPLVLDQPESNVGLEYLTDYIIDQILKMKGERDFILATHHGNVAVLTHADRVVETAVDEDSTDEEPRGIIAAQGTREEMKDRLNALTEGGMRAFRERMKFYGFDPDKGKK